VLGLLGHARNARPALLPLGVVLGVS